MTCIRIPNGVLCVATMRTIEVDGRDYLFEMSRWCGPMPEKPKRVPAAFWHAVTLWSQQGEQTDGRGRCIYDCASRRDAERERAGK